MAQFVVRNIENAVKARLQRRARRNGRSMEEEVRDILRSAVHEERPRREIRHGNFRLVRQGRPRLRNSRAAGT